MRLVRSNKQTLHLYNIKYRLTNQTTRDKKMFHIKLGHKAISNFIVNRDKSIIITQVAITERPPVIVQRSGHTAAPNVALASDCFHAANFTL